MAIKPLQIENRERGMVLEDRGPHVASVSASRDLPARLEQLRRDPPFDAKAKCPACYQHGMADTIKDLGEAEDIEARAAEIRDAPLIPKHLHVGASFHQGSRAVLDAVQGGEE